MERGRGLADGMAGREDERPPPGRLAASVTVSCRATFLAFLIHQRFSDEEEPAVVSSGRDVANGLLRGPRTAPTLSAPSEPVELALLDGCIPVTPALERVAVRTMQLASKLRVLVDAGLLWRFPGGTRPIRTFASSALPSMMAWGEQPGFCVRERGGDGAVPRHAQPRGRHSPAYVEAER